MLAPIEPGHFRFTASGETVVRLEQRLGYVHKGVEALLIGAPLDRATQLAARASGDSTVAYALAFARAVEAALGITVPARATWLRALMAELERIANHLGDFGAICNDASFVMMHAQCGMLREKVLRASNACFGHRLMMDRVVPGGTWSICRRRDRYAAVPCFRNPGASSEACRTVRYDDRLVAGSDRQNWNPDYRSCAAVWGGRICRPGLGADLRRPTSDAIPTLQRTQIRCASPAGR